MVIWGPNYSLREPGSPEKVDFWTTGFDFRKEAFGGLGQQKWPVEAKQRPLENGPQKALADQKMASRGQMKA